MQVTAVATIRPLSGIVKSTVLENVENIRPLPGTSNIGSAEQFFSSNQYGRTGRQRLAGRVVDGVLDITVLVAGLWFISM